MIKEGKNVEQLFESVLQHSIQFLSNELTMKTLAFISALIIFTFAAPAPQGIFGDSLKAASQIFPGEIAKSIGNSATSVMNGAGSLASGNNPLLGFFGKSSNGPFSSILGGGGQAIGQAADTVFGGASNAVLGVGKPFFGLFGI